MKKSIMIDGWWMRMMPFLSLSSIFRWTQRQEKINLSGRVFLYQIISFPLNWSTSSTSSGTSKDNEWAHFHRLCSSLRDREVLWNGYRWREMNARRLIKFLFNIIGWCSPVRWSSDIFHPVMEIPQWCEKRNWMMQYSKENRRSEKKEEEIRERPMIK